MAGCSNCDEALCSCVVLGSVGDGTAPVTVTGSGDPDDPYVVSATVDICEVMRSTPTGSIAIPGTDRVLTLNGTTCLVKTLPASGGGGGSSATFNVNGDSGTSFLVDGDTLRVLGLGHVNTTVSPLPPGTTTVRVGFDEHYSLAGAASVYSGASPVLGVGGPHAVNATVPAFTINNPSADRTLELLFTLSVQGNITVNGGGQQTGDVDGIFNLNGAGPTTVIHGFVGVNEATGLVPMGNSFHGTYSEAASVPPGSSILVGGMACVTTTNIQVGNGQLDADCRIEWVGGTNQ